MCLSCKFVVKSWLRGGEDRGSVGPMKHRIYLKTEKGLFEIFELKLLNKEFNNLI